MAQALEKHQFEKSLFRSTSKYRESLPSTPHTAPVFRSSPFSSKAPTIDERGEPASPHLTTRDEAAGTRSRSSTFLLPPGAIPVTPSREPSIIITPDDVSPSLQVTKHASSAKPTPRKRIGTSLESWSRYPSHSRAERCGSAGRPDDIITRDFAVDVDHAAIHNTEDAEAPSPASKQTNKSKRSRMSLPKSHSTTFNNIVRYYSNLFSSSSVGQNRRTSITTGGQLKYPELEIIPPQMAEYPAQSPHHHKHGSTFARVKEVVKEDAERIKEVVKEDAERIKEFVREEEDRVEEYVREEEDKFESFVRREEDAFEGFVRKEEQEFEEFVKKEEAVFKDYVKKEEEKLSHHRHHRHHLTGGRDSPFREISLFDVKDNHSQHSASRRETMMIGPTENAIDDIDDVGPSQEHASTAHALDGTTHTTTNIHHVPISKAEAWSDVYRNCLVRPKPSFNDLSITEISASLPPPTLKPTKPRSPQQPKSLDMHATIRKFPSVTVIDDRKGHFRSISLISVQTWSTGFEKASTHDLLELVQAREREERGKLLRPMGSVEGVRRYISY